MASAVAAAVTVVVKETHSDVPAIRVSLVSALTKLMGKCR